MDEPRGARALVGRDGPTGPRRGATSTCVSADATCCGCATSRAGDVHVVAGEYREVDRPRRLVYTWRWEGERGPDAGHVSLVTVEFVPAGDGTTIVLEHSGPALRGIACPPLRGLERHAREPRPPHLRRDASEREARIVRPRPRA